MRLCSVALLVATALLASLERATSVEFTTADYSTVIIRSLTDHQNDGAAKRLLRRYNDNDEERAIGGGTISELASKLKDSVSKFTKTLVNSNKYEAQAAAKLQFGHITDTLTSSNLERLTKEIQQFNSKNIIKKVSLIGTLTAHYGDDTLAKALVTAEKDATSPLFAQQIQGLRNDQLTRWLKGGNSADDVFTLLKLRDDGYKMVISRKLEVLDNYAKLVKTKNSDQTSLLATLIKGFGGEDKLGTLLQTAKTNSRTREKAKELESSLMSKWAGEGQLPANVFQWLKLYDDVDNAFTADNLNKFVKYVNDFNKENSRSNKAAIEIYTNSFREADVTKKLVSAMNSRATRTVAKNLQAEQFQGWVKSAKSVDDVFTILKIERNENAAIISWKLDVLEKFVKLKDGEQNLIKTLTSKFGGNRNLATILERANTAAEATTLQKKQFATFVDGNIRPENFLSSVFRTGVSSATDEQKAIVAKFKVFYQSQRSG